MRGPIQTLFCRLGVLALAAAGCGGPASPTDLGAGGDLLPGADLSGPAPVAIIDHSLFYSDAALLDAADGPSLARTMALAAPDGHGGRLLSAWFHRFATTAHSERAGPAQLVDAFAAAHGADAASWNLDLLPFKPTGVHNRIDLAQLAPGGHCGELRVSYASVDPVYQPFHLLFLFRQPLLDGDTDPGGAVTCAATARRWLALSALDGAAFLAARAALLAEGLSQARFLMVETVEFTVAPWEWRQWVKVTDPTGALPYVFDNQPLFQTAEPSLLNAPGALRDDFLAWVRANAKGLGERRVEVPDRFKRESTHVTQGVPRVPLSLDGLGAGVLAAYPTLRRQIELMGCPACHTTDADFVQTRPDRSVSPFYMKELEARRVHLDVLGAGLGRQAPFGPLQLSPKLPD